MNQRVPPNVSLLQQKGPKRPASQIGGGGSTGSPWEPPAASSMPPNWGAGGSSPSPSAREGSRSSADRNRDNDNDLLRVPHSKSARVGTNARGCRETAAGGLAVEATRETATSGTGGRAYRGTAAVAREPPQSVSSSKRSFGARGLLGASRAGSVDEAGACSTAGGRGHQLYSRDGEEAGAREQATTAVTRGRVGMRKARRTYGR